MRKDKSAKAERLKENADQYPGMIYSVLVLIDNVWIDALKKSLSHGITVTFRKSLCVIFVKSSFYSNKWGTQSLQCGNFNNFCSFCECVDMDVIEHIF